MQERENQLPQLTLPDRLTDAMLHDAVPREKSFRLFDGGGLYLEVMPTGARYWRLKYRHARKERRLSLGVYPAVALEAAREARDDARQLLAAGHDPMAYRHAADCQPLRASFLLSWGDDASLTIHAEGQSVWLSALRVGALRAFLAASEV